MYHPLTNTAAFIALADPHMTPTLAIHHTLPGLLGASWGCKGLPKHKGYISIPQLLTRATGPASLELINLFIWASTENIYSLEPELIAVIPSEVIYPVDHPLHELTAHALALADC